MRYKKPKPVDTVTHKSGIKIDIQFDPNNNTDTALKFIADVSGVKMVHADAQKLKCLIHEYLDNNTSLKWYPVIQVRCPSPFNQSADEAFIGIGVHREYLAVDNAKTLRSLRWDDYEPEVGTFGRSEDEPIEAYRMNHARSSRSGYNLPGDLPVKHHHGGWTLLYTEDLYNGLIAVRDGIRALNEKLSDLLSSTDGMNRIAEFAASMPKLLTQDTDEMRDL